KNHPAQWKAIRRWLHGSGGNLLIYGVGDTWEELGQLESLLEITSEEDFITKLSADRFSEGWALPRVELRDMSLNGVASAPVNADGTSVVITSASTGKAGASFLLRPYGNGVIAAIRSDASFKG